MPIYLLHCAHSSMLFHCQLKIERPTSPEPQSRCSGYLLSHSNMLFFEMEGLTVPVIGVKQGYRTTQRLPNTRLIGAEKVSPMHTTGFHLMIRSEPSRICNYLENREKRWVGVTPSLLLRSSGIQIMNFTSCEIFRFSHKYNTQAADLDFIFI